MHATIEEFATEGYTHVALLLPAMPRHPTAAYQLATENLDKIHAQLASARRLGCPTSRYKSFDFHIPQETDDRVELDERATWFYEAVTSTKGMVNPTLGAGQVYMTTKRDSEGRLLRADKNYKLHVPKDVPVGQFWALTLYSENTRRPYDNGGIKISDVSLDSRMDQLKYNDDVRRASCARGLRE